MAPRPLRARRRGNPLGRPRDPRGGRISSPLIVAVDQGTSSTKAVAVDDEGAVRARVSVAVECTYPRAGWVEQDAGELWRSVEAALAQVRAELGEPPRALGLANQRESVLVWDRATGEPLGPCIGWQCRRGEAICAALQAEGAGELVRTLTGLPLDPSFSAPKLRWLLDSDPRLRAGAERGDFLAGTVDSWIVWNLTGGAVHATDPGNASRTLLLDLERLEWSDELLELFGIPWACLPRIVPSSGVLGEAAGIELAAVVADSHAALVGLGCLVRGSAKATFGTGTSLMTPTREAIVRSEHGLASTVAWEGEDVVHALEGNILSSGATVRWLADLLSVTEREVERLAATVPDARGVQLVPAFAGLGAPYWDTGARGRIEGLTFGTGAAHLARAAVDSIALQVADLVDAVDADLGEPLSALYVDGGASRNDRLVQLQANLIGRTVRRSGSADGAAVGAALLAGLATGVWADEDELGDLDREVDTFEPRPSAADRELLASWRSVVP